jgi:hypothetical protein
VSVLVRHLVAQLQTVHRRRYLEEGRMQKCSTVPCGKKVRKTTAKNKNERRTRFCLSLSRRVRCAICAGLKTAVPFEEKEYVARHVNEKNKKRTSVLITMCTCLGGRECAGAEIGWLVF